MNIHAKLRPELKEKICIWILSFYHLDPRYKILTFFNLVASEGADNVTDDQNEGNSYAMMRSSSSANKNGSRRSNMSGGSNGNNRGSLTSQTNRSSDNGSMISAPSNGSTNIITKSSSSSIRSSGAREAYKVNAHLLNRPSARNIRPSTLSLLSRIFNATSILTVWRPCSNDAMRKMMEGTGVGKGLDIKGKSAKKGALSAFVPFLQIFHNEQKEEIQPMSVGAEMRIYYKSEKLRDHVYKRLKNYLEKGPPPKTKKTSPMEAIKEDNEDAEIILADPVDESASAEAVPKGESSSSLSDVIPEHKNPNSLRYVPTKLKKIKKFAKTGYWGIECSQRLFWYATIEDADISREGTGTETGRPSLPGFQDANMKTLKMAHAEMPKPNPMPVILQCQSLEDCIKKHSKKTGDSKEDEDDEKDHPLDDCLDPRWLVMAYEEQGTIKPVVSDFDGFLLGWRREALWFGCNLPRYQEDLMIWCVERIEEILDDQQKNPTNSDTWTQRWLEVKKKWAEQGFHIETPEYGFGDPKSTSIMEHAALKLKSTGAVRHGSECFNYGFPQEIDDTFLVISDTLKPVPWKYVNIDELQTILSQKIAEGFVFPLNPKWILCDPGWKKIFDDLMASDALYADLSKDVWYPPHTGIREKIDAIYKRHPNGFQRCTDPAIANRAKMEKPNLGRRQSATNILRDTLIEGAGSELTGNAFADLAQLELDDFVGRTSSMPSRGINSKMSRDILHACKELDDDYSDDGGAKNQSSVCSNLTSSNTSYATSSKKGITWSHPPLSPNPNTEKRGSFVSHTSSISSANSKDYGSLNGKVKVVSSAPHLSSQSSSASTATPRSFRKFMKGTHSSKNFFRKKSRQGSCGHSRDADDDNDSDSGDVSRPSSAPDLSQRSKETNKSTNKTPRRHFKNFLRGRR